MSTSNTVHGLWIKGGLSSLELLTVYSYCAQGYQFVLWTYNDPGLYNLPEGASVADAREVLPENRVFCYKYSNQFGHGKGSYAGFSDIFRYKLLYEKGDGGQIWMYVACSEWTLMTNTFSGIVRTNFQV